jgi:ribonuclease R
VRRLTDDYYPHDPERMELKGRSNGKVFHIGDRIRVRLAQADPIQGWVDFDPVPEEGGPLPPAPPRPGSSRPGAMDRPPRGPKASQGRKRRTGRN